jgi:hypothetical protein
MGEEVKSEESGEVCKTCLEEAEDVDLKISVGLYWTHLSLMIRNVQKTNCYAS